MSLAVVYEGDTDRPVVDKLAADAGIAVTQALDCGGKSRLDHHLVGYNQAARGSPWLVLRDLDQDADCAPTWLASHAGPPSTWMCLRLAVRALESWLLADRAAFARFFAVREGWLPRAPDAEADPTRALVAVVTRSRRAALRKGVAPRIHGRVGPLYESLLIEFATEHWRLDQACEASPSLRRARAALRDLAARWLDHCRGQRPRRA